ncbi:MAG: SCP2 sterol-binding domain-containing protein [Actinomycetota bacterium]|nr:SCP2 sterol-binding domain-containing protein [Actinomycetota bacterium]
MAVKFLSPEWAQELTDRLNSDESFTKSIANQQAKIQQVITGPDGEQKYWMTLEDGKIGMGVGELDDADATITQDYATAVALARSELNAVTAFMSGRIRISNLGFLMPLQGALSELPAAMQEIDTDY